MPSSNILLFDANKANMMADEQYNTNSQRLNGVQSGIASSQLQNKTLYQVSLVAYAIAQIMNQNGLDANDTAAVSAFVANLSGTMLQKVADLATTQEAQAGVATGKWMSPALVKAAMDTYTSEKWLPLTGGTMQGNLILNADPTANLGAATKQYVDNRTNLYPNNIYTNLAWTYMGRLDTSSNTKSTSFTINKTINKLLFVADLTGRGVKSEISLSNGNGTSARVADLRSQRTEGILAYEQRIFIFGYNASATQCISQGNLLYTDSRCNLNVNSDGSIVYSFVGNSYTVGDVIDVYYI